MKKLLPYLIAVLAFLAVTWLYFSPLFQGKELRQMDINNWKGMAQEIVEHKEKTGEFTYWTNSMFGGMPGYQISAVYGANLIQYIDKVIMFFPSPANFFFLYLVGFYFMLLILGVDKRVAIIGAFAFAFSSYFIIILEAGHNSKAHAIGYMAPVVAGVLLAYRGRLWLGAAVTGLALSLQLNANHLQITYYLGFILILLAVMELIGAVKEKKLGAFFKTSAALVLVALLAMSTNVTNLWATQEYAKYSTRGPSELTHDRENQTSGLDRDYIMDWSYGIGESFTFIVPDFKGGGSEPIAKNNKDALKEVDSNFRQNIGNFSAYFGDQPFTSGPVYLGAIVCLLFLIGAFTLKGPEKWWLVSATILSILLSWGKNFRGFTELFLDFVPAYDKFRAVSMILVIAEFTVPLLATLTLDKILKEENYFSKNRKPFLYTLGAVAGLVLLINVAPGMFTNFYTESEYEQVVKSVEGQNVSASVIDDFFSNVSAARKHILASDAMRSLGFIFIAGALLFFYVKKRFSSDLFVYSLMALIVLDLSLVGKRYLHPENFVRKQSNAVPWIMTKADEAILRDTTQSYRVVNLAVNTFNDASTSYYHQSIGGYHGAKMKRYKELIDFHLLPEITSMRKLLQNPDTAMMKLMASHQSLNMLNTKYIIYNPDAPPLQNPGALGNAWFVSEFEIVQNADSEIAALASFNPRTTAIVDKRYENMLQGWSYTPDTAASIVLTQYEPDHLVYSSSASAEQLAVFSEIHYDKGWNVYVDGQKADYFRVNYVLRGMRIPAGTHTIEWKFEPEVVVKGEKIALAASSLVILLFIAGIFMDRKSRMKESQ